MALFETIFGSSVQLSLQDRKNFNSPKEEKGASEIITFFVWEEELFKVKKSLSDAFLSSRLTLQHKRECLVVSKFESSSKVKNCEFWVVVLDEKMSKNVTSQDVLKLKLNDGCQTPSLNGWWLWSSQKIPKLLFSWCCRWWFWTTNHKRSSKDMSLKDI